MGYKLLLIVFFVISVPLNTFTIWNIITPCLSFFSRPFYYFRSLGDRCIPATRADFIKAQAEILQNITDEHIHAKKKIITHIDFLFQTSREGLCSINQKIELNQQTIMQVLQSVEEIKHKNYRTIKEYHAFLVQELRKKLHRFSKADTRISKKIRTNIINTIQSGHLNYQKQLQLVQQEILTIQDNNRAMHKSTQQYIERFNEENIEHVTLKQRLITEKLDKDKEILHQSKEKNENEIEHLRQAVHQAKDTYALQQQRIQTIAMRLAVVTKLMQNKISPTTDHCPTSGKGAFAYFSS